MVDWSSAFSCHHHVPPWKQVCNFKTDGLWETGVRLKDFIIDLDQPILSSSLLCGRVGTISMALLFSVFWTQQHSKDVLDWLFLGHADMTYSCQFLQQNTWRQVLARRAKRGHHRTHASFILQPGWHTCVSFIIHVCHLSLVKMFYVSIFYFSFQPLKISHMHGLSFCCFYLPPLSLIPPSLLLKPHFLPKRSILL